MKKIEFGSDLSFVDPADDYAGTGLGNLYQKPGFYFSGRSALYLLLKQGIRLRGWKNIFLPEYYCPEVENFISRLPIAVHHYTDSPCHNFRNNFAWINKKENVIVQVNYFGCGRHPELLLDKACLVEDHTHDLISEWALTSHASYCFASLRKSLPVPAGGILWSPRQHDLPPPPPENDCCGKVAFMKLAAMVLKTRYLEGANVRKTGFRGLYADSEAGFSNENTNAGLPAYIRKLIDAISVRQMRDDKKKNFLAIQEAITDKTLLLHRNVDENLCPFGVVLVFPNIAKRNAAKAHLIGKDVYPAILWPNQSAKAAKDFADRMLLLHCDARYSVDDMKAIATLINRFIFAKPGLALPE